VAWPASLLDETPHSRETDQASWNGDLADRSGWIQGSSHKRSGFFVQRPAACRLPPAAEWRAPGPL